MTEKDVYYIGFGEGQALRRSILEAAKAVVYTAHGHSRIAELQDQKLKLRTELASAIKLAKDDLDKLQNTLPYRDVAPPEEQPKRKVTADHKLDKIEAALHEIEQRMRTL